MRRSSEYFPLALRLRGVTLSFFFSPPPLTQLAEKIRGAAQALENANDISEGIASDHLKALLEVNLPKGSKKKRVVLGIADKNLAGSIKAAFSGVDCETNEVVQDLLRGLRLHGPKLLKQLQEGDMDRAQLGLGHAYSRAKVKFSVQKNDNHIIQSIALLDTLDKDINTFVMRIRYRAPLAISNAYPAPTSSFLCVACRLTQWVK